MWRLSPKYFFHNESSYGNKVDKLRIPKSSMRIHFFRLSLRTWRLHPAFPKSRLRHGQTAIFSSRRMPGPSCAGSAIRPEQLRKDIAELYRYVGGKLGPIEFVLEGHSSRAFARGKTLIAVQGSFNKETLFHECGHLAEAWDMSSQAACLQFVRDRAKGDLVSLKKLTGGSYRSNERAYPDDFTIRMWVNIIPMAHQRFFPWDCSAFLIRNALHC